MNIIFSRHGNTFEPHQVATWIGQRDDVPLVEAGMEQAKKLARAIRQSGMEIQAVYCSPLQRTRRYADLLLQELPLTLQPIIDTRLNELDYGGWSGLTRSQICEAFSSEELVRWEQSGQWPINSGWGHSESVIGVEVRSFAAHLIETHQPDETILVISSNGCRFTYTCDQWKCLFWNERPDPALFMS
jgi:broad specificity phosphatase PhoE